MAREYGVEAFCYYHYWFGNGRRLLQRPFEEVLQSGTPAFPFCLCWANESWTGIWHGLSSRMLVEQCYPGLEDAARHFDTVLPAFLDKRYVRIDGKPVFLIYNPSGLPDAAKFTDLWRSMAVRSGLPGLFFVGVANEPWRPEANGFDGAIPHVIHLARQCDANVWMARLRLYRRRLLQQPALVFPYEQAIKHFVLPECEQTNVYPCVIPNWDNSPRSGLRGLVLQGSTPELFRGHLRDALQQVARKPAAHQIVFIKSWNEWAEGNHLEPDLLFGRRYLEVLREELATANEPLRTLSERAEPANDEATGYAAVLVVRAERGPDRNAGE